LKAAEDKRIADEKAAEVKAEQERIRAEKAEAKRIADEEAERLQKQLDNIDRLSEAQQAEIRAEVLRNAIDLRISAMEEEWSTRYEEEQDKINTANNDSYGPLDKAW